MNTHEVQTKILQVISDFNAQSPHTYMTDGQIAEKLSLNVQDVQMHLDLLKEEGFINLYMSSGPIYSVMLTSRGRMVLQDPAYFRREQAGQGDTFHMSGDFRNAIISIKSTLTDVQQTVNTLSTGDPSKREELAALIAQLNEELQNVPPEKEEDAEAVARTAEMLIDSAKDEKPNKTMIEISGEGLKKAAKNIADVMPIVLTIATQIVQTVNQLVK